jgi:hypothetical protein
MKKLPSIIGLVLFCAGAINLSSLAHAEDLSTNAYVQTQIQLASAKAQIKVVTDELRAQFFVVSIYSYGGQPRITGTLKTNAVVKIPATVSALTGGGISVSPSAPVGLQTTALLTCINSLSAPVSEQATNAVATLAGNLAALQAGLAAARQ